LPNVSHEIIDEQVLQWQQPDIVQNCSGTGPDQAVCPKGQEMQVLSDRLTDGRSVVYLKSCWKRPHAADIVTKSAAAVHEVDMSTRRKSLTRRGRRRFDGCLRGCTGGSWRGAAAAGGTAEALREQIRVVDEANLDF